MTGKFVLVSLRKANTDFFSCIVELEPTGLIFLQTVIVGGGFRHFFLAKLSLQDYLFIPILPFKRKSYGCFEYLLFVGKGVH